MSRTDLISDALTIIRNAVAARKEDCVVPYSGILEQIFDILTKEGYLDNYKVIEVGKFKQIKGYLRYSKRKSAIARIQRVSTPGRRVYAGRQAMSSVLRGHGVGIVTTSLGVMTDRQAREKGVGGEYLMQVW